MAIQVLYPFAPHISEELWEHLGETTPLAYYPLFKVEPKYLVEDKVTYIIQINGKLRARIVLSKDTTKDEVLELAKKDPNVQRHLGADIIKTIFVPQKLLNIVVKKS